MGILIPGTEIDVSGTVLESSRSSSKLNFCKLHGLQPRDLRKLDARCVEQHPAILVRPSAILVNLNHLRALIKADKCILFDVHPSEHALIQELQLKLTSKEDTSVPYEFVVLEAVFQTVLGTLDKELKTLANPIQKLLFRLFNEHAQYMYLSDLFVHVQQISFFQQKIQNIRDILRDLLENDDDLNDMYLTKIAQHLPIEHHDDIELLLETYLANTEELLDAASMLVQTVTTAERLLTLSLDTQRNRLLILEIQFAMFGVACCCGSLLASLYGMNVPSGLEQHPSAFFVLAKCIACVTIGVLGAGIWRIRQVRRMFNATGLNSFMKQSTPLSFHHGLRFTSV
ncbi:magnesium ion transporter [Coelomomyces lativittatus]|nr:magnesium ion transporter [Coelomomyces lativittatus]